MGRVSVRQESSTGGAGCEGKFDYVDGVCAARAQMEAQVGQRISIVCRHVLAQPSHLRVHEPPLERAAGRLETQQEPGVIVVIIRLLSWELVTPPLGARRRMMRCRIAEMQCHAYPRLATRRKERRAKCEHMRLARDALNFRVDTAAAAAEFKCGNALEYFMCGKLCLRDVHCRLR